MFNEIIAVFLSNRETEHFKFFFRTRLHEQPILKTCELSHVKIKENATMSMCSCYIGGFPYTVNQQNFERDLISRISRSLQIHKTK